MTLTLGDILNSAGIALDEALVIRHAYTQEHEDGTLGLSADSTPAEILLYTSQQSPNPRQFPALPPRYWVVFLPKGGDRGRLWSVLENQGEATESKWRNFNLVHADLLADLRDSLVIEWRSPRTWRVNAATASPYRVLEIADAKPIPFPGFDRLVLSTATRRGAPLCRP